MEKTPYFSVIVPMYNVQRYIKLCIDSILNQTFKDFEIIIVDDASTDDSYKICHERYSKNEKVRIIRYEKNQGSAFSRNTGIENAHGKYIYFLDSDDLIMTNTLEKIHEVAEKTDADVIRTAGYFVTHQDDDKPININKMQTVWDRYNTEGFLKEDKYYRIMEHYYNVANGTKEWLCCYKRDFLQKNCIRFENIIAEDKLFTIEIYCSAEKYYIMHSAFYVYRKHAGSINPVYDYGIIKENMVALPIISSKLDQTLMKIKPFIENSISRKIFIEKILSEMVEPYLKPMYDKFNEESKDKIKLTTDPQNELLKNQNNLLEKMNTLLEQQKTILQHSTSFAKSPQVFIKNLEHDEIRDGFLVTSHRKKLWNVQIGLINEFARICKKYNLRWFAYGGTLLGAARHKGFIPWDDDVDVAMFRPDYEKFKKVAAEEIKYPYFFDNWYNHRLESDETPDPETQFPFFTRANEKRYWGMGSFPSFPVIKLRDSRTTMIEFPDRKDANQGIWIDIFPLDIAPPFTNKKDTENFRIASELIVATTFPKIIRKVITDKKPTFISYDELNKFLKLNYRERGIKFDNFMLKIFSHTEKADQVRLYPFSTYKPIPYYVKDLENVVYLPFEEIEIPAPAGYENCLKSQYGDWRKPVIYPSHTREYLYSAEIPYTEYYKKALFR